MLKKLAATHCSRRDIGDKLEFCVIFRTANRFAHVCLMKYGKQLAALYKVETTMKLLFEIRARTTIGI